MKEIGVDISSYEPILKKEELTGLRWIGFKVAEVDDRYRTWSFGSAVDIFCTNPTYVANWVQTAYDLNIPACAYIYDNPAYKMDFYASSCADHIKNPNNADPQMRALRQSLQSKTIHAICIDVERWWKSYNQYYTNPGTAEKIPDTWIRDSAQDLYNRIKEDQNAGLLPNVPIWFYTAKWFVNGYSSSLDSYLQDKIQWLAVYTTPVYSQTKGLTKTWPDIKTIVDSVTYNPAWVGNKQCEIVQLTDAVTLPGIYYVNPAGVIAPHNVDLDVVIASDLLKIFAPGRWQNLPPPPPPPPPTPATDREIIEETLVLVKEIRAKLG